MVDGARAFCPGCGHALVEEKKRKITSGFESVDHTVQMGNTMYNQMLSDMGLNISKQPKKTVATVAPAAAPTQPAVRPAENAQQVKTTSRTPNYLMWIIIGAAVVLFLALIVVFVAALMVYWFSGRA